MKKFKEHKFHSRSLIPSLVAKDGPEAMAEFERIGRMKSRFCEGEKVVHVDNLDTIMTVQEILRVKKMIRGKEVNALDGIVCHWWEEIS
jgi:hypothetical protein